MTLSPFDRQTPISPTTPIGTMTRRNRSCRGSRTLPVYLAFMSEFFFFHKRSLISVNQHGKLTRDPGKSALKNCHPGDVQLSGAFAGATWGDRYGIHSRNQTASFCGR
jgi:hypothetical protein